MKHIKLFESFVNENEVKFDSDLKSMLWHERTKFEHISSTNPFWKKFISPTTDIITELTEEEIEMLCDLCIDRAEYLDKLSKKQGYENRSKQAEKYSDLAEEIKSSKKISGKKLANIAMDMIDMRMPVIAKHFTKETPDQATKRAGIIS